MQVSASPPVRCVVGGESVHRRGQVKVEPTTGVAFNDLENYNRLLTVKELAALLSVSDKTIYAYVSRNLIPYLKIESSVRFRPRAIAAWLQARECLPVECRNKEDGRRGPPYS